MAVLNSESSQTSNMGLFANIVNCQRLLNIFEKSSILDVLLDSEYACNCKNLRRVRTIKVDKIPKRNILKNKKSILKEATLSFPLCILYNASTNLGVPDYD